MALNITDNMNNFLCCKSPSKLAKSMFYLPLKKGMSILNLLNVIMSLYILYFLVKSFFSLNIAPYYKMLGLVEHSTLLIMAFLYLHSIILNRFGSAYGCYKLSIFQSIISISTSLPLIKMLYYLINYPEVFGNNDIVLILTVLIFKILNFYMLWIYFSFAKQLIMNSKGNLIGVNIQNLDSSRNSIVTGIVIGEYDKIQIYQASNSVNNTNYKV